MYVVLDTNVLVSAFWAENGVSARVLSMALNSQVIPCHDHRILEEYRAVLTRPHFGFSEGEVADILSFIRAEGMSVIAAPLSIDLPDNTDKMFFEVGTQMDAAIITGNKKHFPAYEKVYSPAEFLEVWASGTR
ncbi:MAG: putative toxin-antitoxin system toxin component, PIN family [Clostridiales bacterium]|nr:putative toxin-antitoxin system toxin component, PIN family [Clostridiales bacterium]